MKILLLSFSSRRTISFASGWIAADGEGGGGRGGGGGGGVKVVLGGSCNGSEEKEALRSKNV